MASYPLPVKTKCSEGRDAASIWLEIPKDLTQAFTYRAGQFITIEPEIAGETLMRQYSLSSSPGRDDSLRITVKKIPDGRVSSWLVDDIGEGELLEVATPRGVFFRPPETACHVLLLAVGSGVAPMIPIARALLDSKLRHKITFACGNRSETDIMLRGDIDALAAHPDVTVEHVISRDESWPGARGRIDRAYLQAQLPAWTERCGSPMLAYLCGPEAFMDAAESALMCFGLDRNNIRMESFDLVLNDEDDGEALPLTCDNPGEAGPCETITAVVTGEEIEVVPEEGETILDALVRVDADVPFSCQEGTCSSCISKLTAGAAEVRPSVLKTLREDDLEEGLTLACLTRPTARHVRIDFDEI